jgi:hypothetical protein
MSTTKLADMGLKRSPGAVHHWIFERHALSVVLTEPLPRGILIREYLEVILVANLLAYIDVNPDGHHQSSSVSRPFKTR